MPDKDTLLLDPPAEAAADGSSPAADPPAAVKTTRKPSTRRSRKVPSDPAVPEVTDPIAPVSDRASAPVTAAPVTASDGAPVTDPATVTGGSDAGRPGDREPVNGHGHGQHGHSVGTHLQPGHRHPPAHTCDDLCADLSGDRHTEGHRIPHGHESGRDPDPDRRRSPHPADGDLLPVHHRANADPHRTSDRPADRSVTFAADGDRDRHTVTDRHHRTDPVRPSPRPRARTHPSKAVAKAQRFWRFIPYGGVAGGAIYGQVSAGITRVGASDLASLTMVILMAVAIEGGAVWMAYLAKQRGELGENPTPFFVISSFFAALAVGINVLGHWGDLWSVALFGGLSAAGYVIWCFDLNALLDDAWDPDGTIRRKVPGIRVLKKLTGGNMALAKRARRIALLYAESLTEPHLPGMGPARAIELAQQQIAEETRRSRLEASVRQIYLEEGASTTDIELALLAYGADGGIAAAIAEQVSIHDMAASLAARIAPKRLAGSPVPRVSSPPRRSAPPPSPPAPPSAVRRRPSGADDVIDGEVIESRKSVGPGRGSDVDPWEKYASILRAVAEHVPDWDTRDHKIRYTEVAEAQAAAAERGRLDKTCTSKPYLLKLALMAEALTARASEIPAHQWETGHLRDVPAQDLQARRLAILGS